MVPTREFYYWRMESATPPDLAIKKIMKERDLDMQ
jgi:hypothetical protein